MIMCRSCGESHGSRRCRSGELSKLGKPNSMSVEALIQSFLISRMDSANDTLSRFMASGLSRQYPEGAA